VKIEEWRVIVTDVKVAGRFVAEDFDGAGEIGRLLDDEKCCHPMPTFGVGHNRMCLTAPSSERLGDLLRKLRAEQDRFKNE
jgi:hypothetical protein